MFNALMVNKDDEGKTSAAVRANLGRPICLRAEVTVAVEYSTVNYKDGLCIGPGGGLVRNYPHIPGIDFAGHRSKALHDDRYAPGDKVVLTGWRVGEAHWGGYAAEGARQGRLAGAACLKVWTRARPWPWAPPGFTAMLAVMALEDHGITPDKGPKFLSRVLQAVSGSVATAIFGQSGLQGRRCYWAS